MIMNKIRNTVHLSLSYVGFAHCKYMIPSYNGKEEVVLLLVVSWLLLPVFFPDI